MQSHLGNVTLAGLGDDQTAQEEPNFWQRMQSSMTQMIQPVMDIIPGMDMPQLKERAAALLPTSSEMSIQPTTVSPIPVVDPNVRASTQVEEPSGGIGKGALIAGGIAVVGLGIFLARKKKR